ncbi:uncharacterized protein LOC133803369 isoform X1 [Humulus lupulus]|uniref:uncharacterized protein LOC133803369 isoform X1 n=1 Tax=Humulus lupulus TaxID=3486 RepID=UPI002B402493|nr:uncharacterized protein LOC133803369 isoform X1 [Humulus lupulus]XP_062097366.1 uncharacterized protein LOC133803369 isoform X1 [Humulus lupulus]
MAIVSSSCFSIVSASYSSTRVEAESSSSNHRPAVILPGLGNNSGDYHNLQLTLKHHGIPSVVAKVSRLDWFRNAAGLVDPNYWRGTLRPRPVLDWYLNRVDQAIQEAKELSQGKLWNERCNSSNNVIVLYYNFIFVSCLVMFLGESLSVIGHSAGGWLARVYMQDYGVSHISLLLTLGTPHLPPPKGVIDQTRGLLNYVEYHCSKAVYTPHLKYVCIAGRYIEGAPFFGNSMNGGKVSFRSRFVGQGYKQVCGKADVWGDGVVPEESAHLEGALNVSLEGVYHSPVGSDDDSRPWYGSPAVLHQWIHHLL